MKAFLSRLFSRISEENVLVILSSDHGGSDSPEEVVRNHGLAGRVTVDSVKAALERALSKAKVSRKVLAVTPPYAFLERKEGSPALSSEDARRIEGFLRADLPSLYALRATEALEGEDELTLALRASVRSGVSGELYLVFGPHQHFLQDEKMASTHGSPWDYDREVPIVLSGPGVRSGSSTRPVFVHELAPGVAKLLRLDWAGRTPLGD